MVSEAKVYFFFFWYHAKNSYVGVNGLLLFLIINLNIEDVKSNNKYISNLFYRAEINGTKLIFSIKFFQHMTRMKYLTL